MGVQTPMPNWIARLHKSALARNITFGVIGLMTFGCCGGALLANYTVAGIDPEKLPAQELQAAQSDQVADADTSSAWVRDVHIVDPGQSDKLPDEQAPYQRVSY